MKQKMMILVIYFFIAGNLSFYETKACDHARATPGKRIALAEERITVNEAITAELFPLAGILFNN